MLKGIQFLLICLFFPLLMYGQMRIDTSKGYRYKILIDSAISYKKAVIVGGAIGKTFNGYFININGWVAYGVTDQLLIGLNYSHMKTSPKNLAQNFAGSNVAGLKARYYLTPTPITFFVEGIADVGWYTRIYNYNTVTNQLKPVAGANFGFSLSTRKVGIEALVNYNTFFNFFGTLGFIYRLN